MSKRKLLLADDSITIQKVVNLTFADEGIDVITVSDGDSAIQKIDESRPDLVLADVHMPGLNGYEVCERVRATDNTRDLPVLLLVGSFEPFDENEAARVGANGYMTKPFQSIRQLVSKVTELMESAPASSPPVSEDVAGNGVTSGYDSDLVDRELAMSAETESSNPDVDIAHDIEALYSESIGDKSESVAADGGTSNYVDVGMDDEIIETRYSADSDAAEQMSYSDSVDSETSAKESGREYGCVDSGVEQSPDQFAQTERMDTNFGSPDQNRDSRDQAEITSEYGVEAQAAFEDREAEKSVALPEQTQLQKQETPGSEQRETFEFDDLNLLELPPVGQPNSTELVSPQEASKSPASKQLVTLSPELMDMIVQRVIDKLSEKRMT